MPWLLSLLLVGALAGAAVRLQQNLEAEYTRLNLQGQRMAEDLAHELQLQAHSVASLGAVADSVLLGGLRLMENPVARLQPVPAKRGYTAVLPPRFGPPEDHGNITGLGPVPAPSSVTAREMTMAVSLTPIARAIKRRNPDVPWVYYTSANDFIFLFPRVPVEEFFYSRELGAMENFQGALPANNPQRSIFWTTVYEDAAGQGRMVTVGKPVYRGDRFLGVISIDLSARALLRHIQDHELAYSRAYLYDAQGRPMLGPDTDAPDLDPVRLSLGQTDTDTREGMRLSAYSLPSANWYLVIATDHRAMVRSAWLKTGIHIATALLLLISLVLIGLLLRSMREVRSLSIRDGLTGLYNRRHFEDVARSELARCRRHELWLGLMILDVDFFKKYNDRYGHQMGDAALKDVTAAMRQTLRRATDGHFRVGGEEFAVLVELAGPAELHPLADRLNAAVRELRRPHEDSPRGVVTVSIGSTLLGPGQWVELDAAYRRADEALYEAKQAGRDRHVYLAPN